MRKKVLCAVLIGALVLRCVAVQAQTEPGMGAFAETKKSGINQLVRCLDMPYTLISSWEYTLERAMEWYAFTADWEEGFAPILVMPTEEMSHHALRSSSLWENREEALTEAEEIYQERYGSEKQREELTCSEELLHMIGYLVSLYCASETEHTFALAPCRQKIYGNCPPGCLPVYMDNESWEICLTQAPRTRLRRLHFRWSCARSARCTAILCLPV